LLRGHTEKGVRKESHLKQTRSNSADNGAATFTHFTHPSCPVYGSQEAVLPPATPGSMTLDHSSAAIGVLPGRLAGRPSHRRSYRRHHHLKSPCLPGDGLSYQPKRPSQLEERWRSAARLADYLSKSPVQCVGQCRIYLCTVTSVRRLQKTPLTQPIHSLCHKVQEELTAL
jgi:hypothetical protein